MNTIKKIIWKIFLTIMILLALYRLTSYSQTTEEKEFNESGAERSIGDLNFKLYECTPEKFIELTTLQFQIFEDSDVRLSVNDINGDVIETLADGMMTPGLYKVYFKASKDLSPGEYVCKLEANGSVQTKKIFLLRH